MSKRNSKTTKNKLLIEIKEATQLAEETRKATEDDQKRMTIAEKWP